MSATWVIGEYSEVLLESGLVDEEQPKTVSVHRLSSLARTFIAVQITDVGIVDLLLSVLDSPYTNYLTRQFVLAAITKVSARPTTGPAQQERIAGVLAAYTSNAELETQQRAVEFASLYALGEELRTGVLERMPPPELKATVIGVGESSQRERVDCI